ncbi:hypothetical protein FACS1894122_14180 [Alphaproteobacteria bacterium]|nr:hypothetical protein FACS1894122_14180 [Alphaproteobacteria bacterium]
MMYLVNKYTVFCAGLVFACNQVLCSESTAGENTSTNGAVGYDAASGDVFSGSGAALGNGFAPGSADGFSESGAASGNGFAPGSADGFPGL